MYTLSEPLKDSLKFSYGHFCRLTPNNRGIFWQGRLLNALIKTAGSRVVKHLKIRLARWEELLTVLFIWGINGKWLSYITPKSVAQSIAGSTWLFYSIWKCKHMICSPMTEMHNSAFTRRQLQLLRIRPSTDDMKTTLKVSCITSLREVIE